MSSNTPKKETGRRFGLIPIIDFYVLREFLIPLTALLVGFIFLFLVGELLDDLKDFIRAKADFWVAAKYFMLKLPENVRFILPISILLSCMFTMAKFGKSQEITAMRASGISLLRCGGGIYLVALLLTGVSFWFNESIIPQAELEAKHIKKRLKNPDYDGEQHEWLSYMSTDKTRNWLFNKFVSDGTQRNITIKKFNFSKIPEWTINAKEADFNDDKGWQFKGVTLTSFDKTGMFPLGDKQLDTYSLSLEECPETPESIMNSTKPIDDMPFSEIINKINSTKNIPAKVKAKYETIFYNRLAFPWACMLAVLLGIPLAAKSHRRGIFGPIVTAIVVIIAYQFTAQVFELLGKDGVLNPIIAGAGPTIVVLIYAMLNIVKKH